MTKQTTTPATPTNVGKRVKITLTGHKYDGQRGTIVSQTKSSYKVQIDGVKTTQTVPVANAPVSRGRRPLSR